MKSILNKLILFAIILLNIINSEDINKAMDLYMEGELSLISQELILAENYFEEARKKSNTPRPHFIMEWGVGNGNLAGCFLTHLQSIDTEGKVYPYTRYILCDFSIEILKGARNNSRLKNHAGKFFTVQIDANNMDCFGEHTINKIISNEIWDDLATKILIKQDNSLCEEYLQPLVDPDVVEINFDSFIKTTQSYLKNKTYKTKILVCGFEKNKTIRRNLNQLTQLFDTVICTETGTRQSMDCEKISNYFNNKKTSFNPNIKQVFNMVIKQDKETLVCIIGSHYFGPYISKFYNKSFAKI